MYIIFVLAFIAFDFSKQPITNLLLRTKDDIQQYIYQSDGAELNRKFEAAGTRTGIPKNAEERTEQRSYTMSQVAQATAGAIAMEAKSSAVGSIFFSLLILMGVVSWIAMIWLILARLRDIGWPPLVGLAIVAMPLALRGLNPIFSDAAWYAVQYSFFAAAAALAFIPGNSGTTDTAQAADSASPKTASRKQFGLRS